MEYDIVIIGGGMVGGSLTSALRHANLRVALIDASSINHDDPRLIALNHSSCCLFKKIKIWDYLHPYAEPIKEVHVSYQGKFGGTRLKASDVNLNELGFVVPAKYINKAIELSLDETSKNIFIYRPATLKSFRTENNFTFIMVSGPEGEIEIKTNLLIGADGTHSTTRKLLEISTDVFDYKQSALVTITHLNRSHRNIAHERFHADGAVAMLPLTEQRCATIWSDKTNKITELTQLSDVNFLAELQKKFGYHLGRFLKTEKRHTFPLNMLIAKSIFKDNILLIGNAAHTIHPIAAQGLNLALAEITKLIDVFQSQQNLNLNEYIRWQENQIRNGINLSDRLSYLFSINSLLFSAARQCGLMGLDMLPFLKKQFIWKTVGTNHLLYRD